MEETKAPKKRTAKDNRRYRLHQKIKAFCRYSSAERTVYVPFDVSEIPEPLQELREVFHYAIQTEIQ